MGEQYIIFLRPRRFGKSLWISTLRYYYGLEHQDKFDQLFGQTYIGQHPTSLRCSYAILTFDFSGIRTDTLENTFKGFLEKVRVATREFLHTYADFFSTKEREDILSSDSPDIILSQLFQILKANTKERLKNKLLNL